MCIKWCGGNINRLFTGSVDKQLHAFDVKEMEELTKKEDKRNDENIGYGKD